MHGKAPDPPPKSVRHAEGFRLRRFLKGVLVFVLVVGVVLWLVEDLRPRHYVLEMTAGDALGARHQLAEVLRGVAGEKGVTLNLVPSAGSRAALARLAEGQIDVALIQGGLKTPPEIMELGALYVEPLHLLVSPGLRGDSFESLRGHTINVSTPGSGTQELALEVLAFAGLEPGRDFTPTEFSYEELTSRGPSDLPDALFMVQSLPSPIAAHFIQERGFRILEVPFAPSMSFRDIAVREAVIPRMMYSVLPPLPSEDLDTVGNYLLLVAHKDLPREAALRLLEVAYGDDFARRANLPSLVSAHPDRRSPLERHPGAVAFHERQEPLLQADLIESAENTRSFIVSTAVALFLLWRWYRRRRSLTLHRYLHQVSEIEDRAMELEKEARLDLAELMELRRRLTEVKSEALEKYTEGRLSGEELISGFLNHVADVRSYLGALMLHERERMEEKALMAHGGQSMDRIVREEWTGALGANAPVAPEGQTRS